MTTIEGILKLIAEREMVLWNECDETERDFGVMSENAKRARKAWYAVYSLACLLDIKLLH